MMVNVVLGAAWGVETRQKPLFPPRKGLAPE